MSKEKTKGISKKWRCIHQKEHLKLSKIGAIECNRCGERFIRYRDLSFMENNSFKILNRVFKWLI